MGVSPRRHRIITALCCVLTVSMLLAGCASFIDLRVSDQHYNASNFTAAYQSLERESAAVLNAQGPIILNYDLGLLARLSGDHARSNVLLSESERLIKEAYTRSISEGIASFIVNDNTKAYAGTEYEDLYLNIFKALNYLALGEEEGALVELRRSLEKQTQLKAHHEMDLKSLASYAKQNNLPFDGSQTYATSFSTSALANHLAAIVAESLGDESMALYSQNQVAHAFSTQPTLYPFGQPKATSLSAPEEGAGRLHLLIFTGRSPVKEERWEYIYLNRYDRVRIAYPVLTVQPSTVEAISVRINETGQQTNLERIESLSTIAIDTFAAQGQIAMQKSIMRSMARAAGKAVGDSLSKNENENLSLLGDLMSMFFQISGEVAERADVRSTHYLPSEAWVGAIDLRPGTYTAEISFLNKWGKSLESQTRSVQVAGDGSLSFVEVLFPR